MPKVTNSISALKKRLQSFWFPSIWMIFILILMGIPAKDLPDFDWANLLSFDKWVHFGLFAILCILWFKPLSSATKKPALFSLIISFIYSFLTEFFQEFFVSDRICDIFDIAANLAGSTVGWLIIAKTKIFN